MYHLGWISTDDERNICRATVGSGSDRQVVGTHAGVFRNSRVAQDEMNDCLHLHYKKAWANSVHFT